MLNRQDVESVPKIDIEGAKEEFDRGTSVFVDVRPREAHEKARVPGAVSLPLLQVVPHIADLPRDRNLIFY